ncbi:MAG: indole-3-glycerol phosphate synthase TrpC [Pyrinomonadaceae bacterium]
MSETFLDKILAIKRRKVDGQKSEADLAALKERAFAIRQNADSHWLKAVLSRSDKTNIIAEIKRASPSKGVINDKIDVVETARRYRDGGAAAISVLTEEDFFKGSLDDLIAVRDAVDLPILRKDFVVDEFQIFETAAAGADVMLLIVAALTSESLKEFLRSGRDELGMDVIVEVHTAKELETAVSAGADIIGVNNRDLRTFDISLDVSRNMIEHRPPNVLMIAESGISTREEIGELRRLGFDGFLIGETLMRTANATTTLGGLI